MATISSTPPIQFSVSGKTALITGAGSGINLSFARLLLSKNCNVVIADITLRPEAQALVDKHSIATSSSPRCLFIRTDVTLWPDLDAMFAFAETHFPSGVDIVCPGAGVFEPHWSNFWRPPASSPLSRDSASGTATEGLGHYATLDINITHPIRVTQLALSKWLNHADPQQRAHVDNPKRVVHISSIAGQMPGFLCPLYAASKHALSGFVRSLAPLEEKIGVRVNAVAPGLIRTPLWIDHPEKLAMFQEGVDEWVEPEEVAEAMLECVENERIVGGYVMEVLKDKRRNIEAANMAPPTGPGSRISNGKVLLDEVWVELGTEGWGVVKV